MNDVLPEPSGEESNLIKDARFRHVKRIYNIPLSVLYILGTEFCERFSYYGMKAVLTIYLIQWLKFSEGSATAIYHTFNSLCYFLTLFGAWMSDGWIGKYRTILYLSIVYSVGQILMSTTSLPPAESYGAIISLILIAIGTGGIKPCVSAFGGDQFEENETQAIERFYSCFYFMVNIGSFFSIIITPLLRGTHCFGNDCYPLAFGLPAILMMLSLVIYVCGRGSYKIRAPTGNILSRIVCCIYSALKNKRNCAGYRDHWLKYADEEFDDQFINDVRSFLNVLFVFIPLPMFWALFEQQGSRWTIQAMKLDGDIGITTLAPDQMQALNSVCVLILIPVFDGLIYPLLGKCNLLKRPLQRMGFGMFLTVLSFVCAGILEIYVQKDLPKLLLSGQTSFSVINDSPCSVSISSPFYNQTIGGNEIEYDIPVLIGDHDLKFASSKCSVDFESSNIRNTFLKDKSSIAVIAENDNSMNVVFYNSQIPDSKVAGGFISVVDLTKYNTLYSAVLLHEVEAKIYKFNATNDTNLIFQEIPVGTYAVSVQLEKNSIILLDNKIKVRSGLVSVALVNDEKISDEYPVDISFKTVKASNKISILYQIPQYIIITSGEVLFSISGLAFAYSQSAKSMKCVLQACWLIAIGAGNLIDVIFAGISLLNSVQEFFLFAGLMLVSMIIFIISSFSYQYKSDV